MSNPSLLDGWAKWEWKLGLSQEHALCKPHQARPVCPLPERPLEMRGGLANNPSAGSPFCVHCAPNFGTFTESMDNLQTGRTDPTFDKGSLEITIQRSLEFYHKDAVQCKLTRCAVHGCCKVRPGFPRQVGWPRSDGQQSVFGTARNDSRRVTRDTL